MANLQGYGVDAVGNMLNHYTRHAGDPNQDKYRYANQDIDKSRTHLNYALAQRSDPQEFVRRQIERVDVKPKGGAKATNVISDWVITLPKNPALKGREKEFFEVAYEHLLEQVPKRLVVGAWVHMDENQPHMHFCFCPVAKTAVTVNDKAHPLKDAKGNVKRDKKGTVRYRRVQARDAEGKPVYRTSFAQTKVYTRDRMKKFHPSLEKAMERHFGFRVGIELDESQKAEKALSGVPQEALDVARAAIVEPAQQEADRIVAAAQEKAAALLQDAEERKAELVTQIADKEGDLAELDNKLSDVQMDIEEEQDRLECLRQRADGVARDVGELRPIVAEVRSWEAAGKAERGAILDRVAAQCDGLAGRVRAAVAGLRLKVEELRERIAAPMRQRQAVTRQPSIDDVIRDAKAAADAWNREHAAPSRSYRGRAR